MDELIAAGIDAARSRERCARIIRVKEAAGRRLRRTTDVLAQDESLCAKGEADAYARSWKYEPPRRGCGGHVDRGPARTRILASEDMRFMESIDPTHGEHEIVLAGHAADLRLICPDA